MSDFDFKFDLQLFAGGADGGAGDAGEGTQAGADDVNATGTADDGAKDTFDQDAVDAKIADALKDARKQWEKEAKAKEKKAKADAQRLEKLSEEERTREELENLRKELELKEANVARKELELSMTKVLAKEGVPHEFLNHLIGEDSESTLKNIKGFKKLFDKKVEEAVNERLKSKTPEAGGISLGGLNNGNIGGKQAFMNAIFSNQARRR